MALFYRRPKAKLGKGFPAIAAAGREIFYHDKAAITTLLHPEIPASFNEAGLQHAGLAVEVPQKIDGPCQGQIAFSGGGRSTARRASPITQTAAPRSISTRRDA